MQPDLIGNKLDRMKGAVLGALREKELLQGLVVDPMARPPISCWKADVKRYAKYLRVDAHQIAEHDVPWGTRERQRYFAELDGHSGRDFFLDPDVGVATGEARPQHIKPCEALGLLQDQNVVAVYQHRARGTTIKRMYEVVQALHEQALYERRLSIEYLAYVEPNAGLLFLAMQSIRLRDIEACLEVRLPGSLERFSCRVDAS